MSTYLISYRRTARSDIRLIELPEGRVTEWMEKTGLRCHSIVIQRCEDGTEKT